MLTRLRDVTDNPETVQSPEHHRSEVHGRVQVAQDDFGSFDTEQQVQPGDMPGAFDGFAYTEMEPDHHIDGDIEANPTFWPPTPVGLGTAVATASMSTAGPSFSSRHNPIWGTQYLRELEERGPPLPDMPKKNPWH